MPKVFDLLEADKDVWERDAFGDVWAINYDRAVRILTDGGITGIDGKLAIVADYYGIDID